MSRLRRKRKQTTAKPVKKHKDYNSWKRKKRVTLNNLIDVRAILASELNALRRGAYHQKNDPKESRILLQTSKQIVYTCQIIILWWKTHTEIHELNEKIEELRNLIEERRQSEIEQEQTETQSVRKRNVVILRKRESTEPERGTGDVPQPSGEQHSVATSEDRPEQEPEPDQPEQNQYKLRRLKSGNIIKIKKG